MTINSTLREHVTSVGFALTLSKAQIHFLVLSAHFNGFDALHRAGFTGRHYITSVHALTRRGLVAPGGGCTLTRAGELVADLLKEAGIYADVLDLCGVDKAVAS